MIDRRGGCMRFGFFDQLPCAPGDSERQRYRDFMAQIELGDALGFDTVWLGELHFMDHATVRQSMTLFAHEVLPYCR
jgi:alkanesulfonate monooxygenase SsuD/methylene tetrahydromethanopterin reductase-like flavin-dependent oxidoreductase (luciferase family)